MIHFDKRNIIVNGFEWDTQYTILEAKEFKGQIIVIFDYMEFPTHHMSQNLYSFTYGGEVNWIGENPTTLQADGYVGFIGREDELWVGNFIGFNCKIDPETGKILETIFTK